MPKRRDGLAIAAAAFLAANLLHGADHLRQEVEGLHALITAGGVLGTMAAVAVAVLAARRHVLAAPAAAAVGFTTAVLVTSVHVLPHWSVLSNSYIDDVTVDALSWVVVLLEIGAAFVLGCVATARLRATSREELVTHG